MPLGEGDGYVGAMEGLEPSYRAVITVFLVCFGQLNYMTLGTASSYSNNEPQRPWGLFI